MCLFHNFCGIIEDIHNVVRGSTKVQNLRKRSVKFYDLWQWQIARDIGSIVFENNFFVLAFYSREVYVLI